MKQDMIVILDLGSTQNTVLAREIRDLGVYSEIYPHDISPQALKDLPNVRGVILFGGENRVVDGQEIDVDPALYDTGLPFMAIDHAPARCGLTFASWEQAQPHIREFVFETCGAQANWNMKNFIDDQVEIGRAHV